jgi:hypothetical protein
VRRGYSQDTCQQYSEPGHIVSFSMQVIGMSPSMFMSSVEIALQNSGWTQFDCNAVVGLTGQRFVGYSV